MFVDGAKTERLLGYSDATTVAGNGGHGLSGDNNTATAAQLNNPMGVAVDPAGNIYIADTDNHAIRMIDISTSIITTVAGTGTQGYSGDGGLATSAQLHEPRAVAVDKAGNIYIADYKNNIIRMVTKMTGIITSAFSANGPSGVAVDVEGNVYISNSGDSVVLLFNISTNIITRVAGNGQEGHGGDGGLATDAELFYPYGVAVDVKGNIYIADPISMRIRMVTRSTGIMTTAAGGDGWGGDGGAATSAFLYYPNGVAVDMEGNIFIAETGNHLIRMVTKSNGIITTLYDNTVTSGVAIDMAGHLYITDLILNNVMMITRAPTSVPTFAPTCSPSYVPTYMPTYMPTYTPTYAPTSPPTNAPTYTPTSTPTKAPTSSPTSAATLSNTPASTPTACMTPPSPPPRKAKKCAPASRAPPKNLRYSQSAKCTQNKY